MLAILSPQSSQVGSELMQVVSTIGTTLWLCMCVCVCLSVLSATKDIDDDSGRSSISTHRQLPLSIARCADSPITSAGLQKKHKFRQLLVISIRSLVRITVISGGAFLDYKKPDSIFRHSRTRYTLCLSAAADNQSYRPMSLPAVIKGSRWLISDNSLQETFSNESVE
jgi:hypothetical protein